MRRPALARDLLSKKKPLFTIFLFPMLLSGLFSCSSCNHEALELGPSYDPTCTEEGYLAAQSCRKCGKILREAENIPALGHVYVRDEAVESTCTKTGLTEGYHCSRCGEVLEEQAVTAMKPHEKGKLVSLCVDTFEGFSRPAIFECAACHQEFLTDLGTSDLGLPIVELTGDYTGISKENKVKVSASYESEDQSFAADATLKWQGQSSANYPKKNYSIQFFRKGTDYGKKYKTEFLPGWGDQSKYCLKANYIDFTGARNVCSGKIYGNIAESRDADELSDLVNAGAVDGFPVVLYENGRFGGLYTLNIPKDKWMFGMDDDVNRREAILFARSGDATKLDRTIDTDFDDGIELEFASTEDDPDIGSDWVVDSFNDFVTFINEKDGQDFIDGIDHYLNVDRAIDALLISFQATAMDNRFHNILYATYDGIRWVPSIYDFDGTWGLYYNGSGFYQPTAWTPWTENVLWKKLWRNFNKRIMSRYRELREDALSTQAVDRVFVDFYNQVPGAVYEAEKERWTGEPNQALSNIARTMDWIIRKSAAMDTNLLGESTEKVPYFRVDFPSSEDIVVSTYLSGDRTRRMEQAESCYARDRESGYLDSSGHGSVFFRLPADSDTVPVIEGSYGNLTLEDGVYEISGISSDLSVTFSVNSKIASSFYCRRH